jgi:thiol:disulfide interchange protein
MLTRSFLLLAALCLAGLHAASAHGLPSKFDPRRDAAADVATAVARAAAEGKHVIVDVGGEWCAWCHILDRFIVRDEAVRSALEADYVWVKVNWSPGNKNEPLLSRWPRIASYPHLFVLDGKGRLLHSQPTAVLEVGKDYDPEKMLAFLRDSRPRKQPP